MGYIYKNIAANIATEILPLHTIDIFTSISLCNKGTDCSVDVYVCKILEDAGANLRAQGILDKKEEVYFLYQTVVKQYTTLILYPSDFGFDNSSYSLYVKGTQAVDIIVNATPSTTEAVKTEWVDTAIDTRESSIQYDSSSSSGGSGGGGGGGY